MTDDEADHMAAEISRLTTENEALREKAMPRWARPAAAALAVACVVGALIAAPAWPEVYHAPMSRMSIEPGEPPCFATVRIENRQGVYNRTETLDTGHGPIRVAYKTIGGHNASDHDEVSVEDMPPGVAAHPLWMALPDGETGTICLMRTEGM